MFTEEGGTDGNSGAISIGTGIAVARDTGAITIASGQSIAGSAGSISVSVGNSATAGGSLALSSGASSAADGGQLSLSAGAGTGGTGGAILLASGAGGAGNGGGMSLAAGSSTAETGVGGDVTISAGAGTHVSGGSGGSLTLAGGSVTGTSSTGAAGTITIQAGSSTGGSGGNVVLKPGGTASGSVGEVMMQSAAGTDLFRMNENAASISANEALTFSADSDGGAAAASIALSSSDATVEIRGKVVLHDSLEMAETMLFGDEHARMLRHRSSGMVQSFDVADPTTHAMDMFGAKVTVFANSGSTAMGMAEFLYTRVGASGKLASYQEVQRGLGLSVAVTSTGLTVATTADAYITVVSILLF